jgi:hypothetical protein
VQACGKGVVCPTRECREGGVGHTHMPKTWYGRLTLCQRGASDQVGLTRGGVVLEM